MSDYCHIFSIEFTKINNLFEMCCEKYVLGCTNPKKKKKKLHKYINENNKFRTLVLVLIHSRGRGRREI